MNNLIVLAAFWNEREWVETSLKQLEALNPQEIIISEGSFDTRYPVHSTDGTQEVIADFAKDRAHVKVVEPIRVLLPKALLSVWKGHRYNNHKMSRFRTMLKCMRMHSYRINQALTFNHMIDCSKTWQTGGWFMTYDCDQFYTDESLEVIKGLVNSQNEYGQLVAKERTFFNGFTQYTEDYEARNYNNMPHRIYPNTFIVPTRGLVLESGLSFKYYHEKVKTKDIGFYNHYKLKLGDRLTQAYQVGDRKKPDFSGYDLKNYDKPHPVLIREFLASRNEK